MDISDLVWRKSTRSSGNGGACVEIAHLPQAIATRDSKSPDGPRILLARDEFAALVTTLKH
ncbi:DUF397 domain-containing protein [Actinomadura decatromicini]|uniref:DUF397 domain-containing protein n=1 Tax=Actinomadura decatromicini TaxID=2604572 RepID=A0A5D3FE02_9ACTN|nr:DUF397 domain-containing protein [Actinomadura decatromicini]TYK46010.1 DUF397 domain-containing protein [Actinomadura decatromicini]